MKKLYHLSQKLNRFFVKVLFGPKEGIVERFTVYKKDEEDDDGMPILYIRNVKLSQREVSSLAILIMTFGLLAAITAWDSYFLNESYLCSEEPEIYCFPVPRALGRDAYDALNLSRFNEYRIYNCSYWMSNNVSSRIAFLCFQWVFDSKAAISDVGGLLTMFLITMKITSSGSLTFLNWAIKQCSKKLSQGEVKEIHLQKAVKIFKNGRNIAAGVTTFLELSFGFILILITSFAASRNDIKPITFFYRHGNEMLLVFGIFSTLLFLPLEKYAMAEEMPASNYDEERACPDADNEYVPLLTSTSMNAWSTENP